MLYNLLNFQRLRTFNVAYFNSQLAKNIVSPASKKVEVIPLINTSKK